MSWFFRSLLECVGEVLMGVCVCGSLETVSADGTWPDVDYTSGCPARRANWPAQVHWHHISACLFGSCYSVFNLRTNRVTCSVPLAAAYTGVLPKPEDTPEPQWKAYIGNEHLKHVLDTAMNWWFDRDYKMAACVDQGGTPKCPCSTEGLWNTNWQVNGV